MEGDAILTPGQVLGRYRIVRELGAGGMGAVYEAVHTGLNKRVAMKVLHPAVDRDASIRARFLQEGEVAARIRHPHVVDVHDVATDGGVTYLVMDYLDGEDLAAMLKREAPLPVERAVEVLLPVLDAIHAAHEAGVIHRDLKPANVFLTRGRDGALMPKVLDFGISKILQDQPAEVRTRTGMVMGTPHYMSPEQVHGAKDLDGRADVYALGAIAYECVTGQRAFDGGTMIEILVRIARSDYPPPRAVRPEVPEAFEALIVRSMSADRARRPGSARELGRMMLPFAVPRVAARWAAVFDADGDPTLPPPSGPPTRASAPSGPGAMAQPPGAGAVPQRSAGGGGPHTLGDARPLTANLPATSTPSLRGPIAGVSAALIGAVIAWWMLLRGPAPVAEPLLAPPAAMATFAVEVEVEPRTARIHLDGAPAGQDGRLTTTLPRDGREHRLEISAEGFAPHSSTFRDAAPPARIVLVPLGTNDAPIIY